jgi:catechol 2,3-dioxygenase-like lactoylglutathione lyase family enzyme
MKITIGENNIRCSDLEKSRNFYEKILGFEFVENESGCVRLKLGDKYLLLMPIESGETPKVTFDFMTDSVDLLKEKLNSAGFSTEDRKYQDYNFFTVKDPDGLEFEVIEQK